MEKLVYAMTALPDRCFRIVRPKVLPPGSSSGAMPPYAPSGPCQMAHSASTEVARSGSSDQALEARRHQIIGMKLDWTIFGFKLDAI